MKEIFRKFSGDPDEPQGSSERSIPQPVRQHGPASHDVRFVVKESLNLGFRFLNDFELFLKKIQPEEPQKGEQPETETEKEK